MSRRTIRVGRMLWRHFLETLFSKSIVFSIVVFLVMVGVGLLQGNPMSPASANPTTARSVTSSGHNASMENRAGIGNFQSERELAKIREALQQLRDMSATGNSGATQVMQMYDQLSPRIGRFSTLRQPRLLQYDTATNDLVFDFSVSEASIEMVALNVAFETMTAYLIHVEGRSDCFGINSAVVENLALIWGQLYPEGKVPPVDMKEDTLNTYWEAKKQDKVAVLVTQLCRQSPRN